MKIGFVVQRYGLEIAGGAEYHCRIVAEHLAAHATVEVLTTCAADYVTWANHYPEGREVLNGIPVHRFKVKRPRDPLRFADWTDRVFRQLPQERARRNSLPASERGAWGGRRSTPRDNEDELRWLEEEGPLSPRLVKHLEHHGPDYDFVFFFSYRYYTTYHGVRALRDRAFLVPTAEDDGVYRLSIFPALFRMPRGIVYNSVEERAMIERVAHNADVPGEVVGVGSVLPETMDGAAFRRKHGIDGPFLLYVGRIDENKGCRQLFDFFRRYKRETDSSLKLVLIGKSVLPIPQAPEIVALGFQPDQEKWDALDACDLLVMPSRYESLSMVTLEAWWAERPVLANGKCEVLRGQCLRSNAGLYYSSYDEFLETLQILESNAPLRHALGRNGKRYFERHYAWDVVIGKYLSLIGQIQGENAQARATAAR